MHCESLPSTGLHLARCLILPFHSPIFPHCAPSSFFLPSAGNLSFFAFRHPVCRFFPFPCRIDLTFVVMESTSIPEYRSPIERLALFIRSFLPAQNLQLLFPLCSFLLLLGSSHLWYQLLLSGVLVAMLQQNFHIDSNP